MPGYSQAFNPKCISGTVEQGERLVAMMLQ